MDCKNIYFFKIFFFLPKFLNLICFTVRIDIDVVRRNILVIYERFHFLPLI